MRYYPAQKLLMMLLLVVLIFTGAVQAQMSNATAMAKEIIDTTGVKGGVVVHLGCGNGKLTAALRINDSFTVHGLEADPAKVQQARSYIKEKGIYGPVSVEQYSGSVLPYTDNLINLVVVQDPGSVTRDEVMRILAPGGVACARRRGQLRKIVKPWPDNIDQWTHFLHDASNNAVAMIR